MSPRRAARREEVEARILEIGRLHLAEHGAAGLSLRAVTRDLGMVSSAVYRYVANRDDLLTLLVVDAYTEVAGAVDAAVAAAHDEQWDGRVLALARAFRSWALAEPARFALLYGSPVPGYSAPGERTTEPGTRVVLALAGLVAGAAEAGEVATAGDPVSGERVDALTAGLAGLATDVGLPPDPALALGVVHVWTSIVGAVSLEVFGQYGADGPPVADDLFEALVDRALAPLRGAAPPAR